MHPSSLHAPQAASRAYEYEATTTVKDDYWDTLGGEPALEPAASAAYSALPQGGSYNELMAATDYAKPYDSEGVGIGGAYPMFGWWVVP